MNRLIALPLIWLTAATGTAVAAGARAIATMDQAAIQARTERFFTNAILLKPRATGSETNLEFTLAPLLVQECSGTNSAAAPATIWFAPGQTTIHGRPHRQMNYWWAAPPASDRRQGRPARRGIRITLDSRGLPVIWEVLADPSGEYIIFVAQSLETAAHREHGATLPGRRFAVEASLANRPESIVARVIEDNPAVMGPLAHLAAGGEVTTLICRCMTAQTRAIATNGYYELRPLPKSRRIVPAKVDSVLRLPPDF